MGDGAGAHWAADGRASRSWCGWALTRRTGARLDGVLGKTGSWNNTLLRSVQTDAESLEHVSVVRDSM